MEAVHHHKRLERPETNTSSSAKRSVPQLQHIDQVQKAVRRLPRLWAQTRVLRMQHTRAPNDVLQQSETSTRQKLRRIPKTTSRQNEISLESKTNIVYYNTNSNPAARRTARPLLGLKLTNPTEAKGKQVNSSSSNHRIKIQRKQVSRATTSAAKHSTNHK
jgi:hypothetical protein